MIVDISLRISSDLVMTEEVMAHPELEDGFAWFTWKTSGLENWLEKGLSIVDSLGYLILPSNLPEFIDMPDDIAEH
jgi:hypothetical protein